jgi:heme/copper-type cytochrome/quinol oxidase subunit 3
MSVADTAGLGRSEKSNGWWGMLIFLATETTLFGTMVGSYFYLRLNTSHWPPPGTPEPRVVAPAVLTVLLLSATVPLRASLTAARRGRRGRAIAMLLTAAVIQAAYLAAQVDLYARDLTHFKPQASAYASIYYTLLAVGHFHVFLGLLLDVWVLARLSTVLTRYRIAGLHVVTLYWYVINALTVVVLLIEVSPRI